MKFGRIEKKFPQQKAALIIRKNLSMVCPFLSYIRYSLGTGNRGSGSVSGREGNGKLDRRMAFSELIPEKVVY